jgi:hypothetical protein
MTRWPTFVLVVALVLAATVGAANPFGATAQEATTNEAPSGAVISSALGVQGARIGAAIDVDTFRTRFAEAETPDARAEIVADTVSRTERRLVGLESRLRSLRTARANGSIGSDTYAVRVAPVAANAQSLARVIAEVETTSDDMDAETLREAGVSRDRIDALSSRIDRVVAAGEGAITSDGIDRGLYRKITTAAETYNREIAESNLGVLGTYLGGERINVYIITNDGDTDVISLRMTERNRIRDLRPGAHPDATLRVTADEATARRVVNNDVPSRAANRAFLEGDITIDGLGRYNAIKWLLIAPVIEIIRIVVGTLAWLGLL